jgi:hypothetical protein
MESASSHHQTYYERIFREIFNMAILAKLLLGFAASAGFVHGAAAVPAAAAALKMMSFSLSGNGCPSTTAYKTGPGTISYNLTDFSTEIGPHVSPVEKTKNCGAHISLSQGVPGWSLAVTKVTGEGMWYAGNDTTLTTFVTVFWSQDASKTVSSLFVARSPE